MFLKRLIIENKAGVIRDIPFKKGINLIVDETPETLTQQTTGNNVGKTTVLRLVDYCLGSKGESVYIRIPNFLNSQIQLLKTS